jgi:hypothetical protein
MVGSIDFLACRLFRLEADSAVSTVAEWFVLGLAAAAEVDGWELIFLILFTLMVEEFCATRYFVRAIFRSLDRYVSHDRSPSSVYLLGRTLHIARDGSTLFCWRDE